MIRKEDSMTNQARLTEQLRTCEAQLSIYENELRSSTEGSDYYEAVMSLYVDEIQTYGSLTMLRRNGPGFRLRNG